MIILLLNLLNANIKPMQIFENKKMKTKDMVIVFIAIVILSGFPMWVVNYDQYTNLPWISFSSILIAALCAGILAYNTVHRKSKLILYVVAAHLIALIIKIVIDCMKDPTDHNLFPFEVAFFFIVDMICCLALVLLARLIRVGQA
jgi:hypothetical protein